MKEIITIQIGGYANFVGSHFWNFQDELLGLESEQSEDPILSKSGTIFDVLYRVGETRQGIPTYTPRLLALDLRGSLGAVKATGSLYEEPPSVEALSVATWDGQVSKHIAEPILKNQFLQSLDDEEVQWKAQPQTQQDSIAEECANERDVLESRSEETNLVQSLEDSVQFWTDYSKVHFHPLSLYELEGVWHGTTPFDDFGYGKGLLTGSMKEETDNRLRFFVEESDHLQGLQVSVDDSNGFAGVSADFLEMIADEYGKTPIMLFNIRPPSYFSKPRNPLSFTKRALHDAISFNELSSLSQCSIPVGLPSLAKSGVSEHLMVDDTKNFHTSAVYAAAISCITLPWRMGFTGPSASINQIGVGSTDMASFIHALSGRTGRKVSILDLEIPAPLLPGPDRQGMFDFARFHTLTPDVSDSDDTAASEALVIQGALMADPAHRASVQEVDYLYRHRHNSKSSLSVCHLAAFLCPLAIPLPFPNLFRPSVGQLGEILVKSTNSNPKKTGSGVSSIPISARLRMSAAILPYIESKLHNLQHFCLSRGSLGGQVLETWGFQKDEIQEFYELSSKTAAAYGRYVETSSSESD